MHLLIAAAGSGRRMGANGNKLLLPLAGRSVLDWTLDAVMAAKSIEWVGIIGQPVDKLEIMKLVLDRPKHFVWINGGDTRQESVQRGLAALPDNAEYVLIHDGARCLVEPELIDRCSMAITSGEAIIAATPVTDTIKRVDSERLILETPKREGLWAAQTPQGFSVAQLKQGHEKASLHDWCVTDDASLYELLGWPVRILESGPANIKVTTPFDLIVAEAVLAVRSAH